jgi:hypothetical protein
MTRKEKLQIQKIQLVKDNQYLLKQIVKLSANKEAILIRIKSYNKKLIISAKVSHHYGKESHLQKLGGFVCKYSYFI